ncbi:hypothetical protein CHU98_g2457 [Xylaria longipes]|nr:hypothetical protein CHU98_g2457 [Xylaria longipes]
MTSEIRENVAKPRNPVMRYGGARHVYRTHSRIVPMIWNPPQTEAGSMTSKTAAPSPSLPGRSQMRQVYRFLSQACNT